MAAAQHNRRAVHFWNVGARLTARLEALRLSPGDVARMIGSESRTVKQWTTGSTWVTPHYLLPLSRALKCTVGELIGEPIVGDLRHLTAATEAAITRRAARADQRDSARCPACGLAQDTPDCATREHWGGS